MDTTTVNFAINKLSEGWAKVAPTVANVGEKYVRYVVTEQIVDLVISFGMLVALIWAFRRLWKSGSAAEKLDEPQYLMPLILIGCGLVGCSLWFICGIESAALAITNPEMYTIQSVINAAKGHQ